MKKIDKKNTEDIFGLSPLQAGMLFHNLKNPGSPLYFEQLCLRLSGEIEVESFEDAWNFVIQSNPMLRALFRWEKLDNPIQVILKQHKITPRYHDFSAETPDKKEKHLRDLKENDRREPFDLHDVPFRITLCKLEKNEHLMIISNHHILYDGWSNGIIFNEFFNAYHARLHREPLTPPVKNKFKEFVKRLNRSNPQEEATYWQEYLEGVENPTLFPLEQAAPIDENRPDSHQITFTFPLNQKEKIDRFIKQQKVTFAALIYTAWGILLRKYTGGHDVVFGTTVSGRNVKMDGIEDIVGLFINTPPLRVSPQAGETLLSILKQVNRALQSRETFENTSLVDIDKYIGWQNSEELFDTIMVVENYPLDIRRMQDSRPGSLSVHSYSIREMTNYKLTAAVRVGETIECTFMYSPRLINEDAIRRLFQHFSHIITHITEESPLPVRQLEILQEDEKHHLLDRLNQTRAHYPTGKTIHRLFREQVEKYPHQLAVTGPRQGSDNEETLTYRQLDDRSTQLALRLRESGIGRGHIAAILLDRSIDMVVGILAILKAGAAYLPIDPEYPSERIQFMLDDSRAAVLITAQSCDAHQKINVEGNIIHIDSQYQPPDSSPELPPGLPADLAYIIYTSGTTGKPKGVMIEHRNVVRLMVNDKFQFDFSNRDVWTLFHSFCFDFSVWEMYGALLYGGKLVVVPKMAARDTATFVQLLEEHHVTVLNQTPSAFYNLSDHVLSPGVHPGPAPGLDTLRYVIFGGEALRPAKLKTWRQAYPGTRFINMYGITETTVHVTYKEIIDTDIQAGKSNIGKPIPTLTSYVMDRHLMLMPAGVPGECCVGGDGVGRGYLNRPELTHRKFVSNPYRNGEKLYRSGDRVRLAADGDMEYLGRIDQQVKIRGFRIELGEIEIRLQEHPAVRDALVMQRHDPSGEPCLCAYIIPHNIPHNPAAIANRDLREFISRKLPDYMVPAYFTVIQKLPLTHSGKIDRKSLPVPDVTGDREYLAPRNETEEQLAEIWAEILTIGKENAGIDSNFFELGGHSLKVAGLLGRINKVFDVKIPFSTFFENPTIRGISQYMTQAETETYEDIPTADEKEYYPITPTQKRFYVYQKLKPLDTSYNMNEVMLMEGPLEVEKFEAIFRQMVQRHEILRTSFHLIQGEPFQIIHPDAPSRIELIDLEPQNGQGHEAAARDFIRPFVLDKAPLWRVGLIRIAPQKHYLIFDMHHLIADGVSLSIFIHDFHTLYRGQSLPPLKIRYRDFSQWQESRRQQSALAAAKEQSETLREIDEEPLNLPTDYSRPAVNTGAGHTLNWEMPDAQTKAVYQFCGRHDVTLYMLLLAAFNVLLSKLSGQENIVLGSPIAGRNHPEVEQVIGLFLNILCQRNQPSGDKTFADFLREVKQRALHAYDHQDYQYEELVDQMARARESGRNPLFDVMIVLQNMDLPDIKIPGVTVTRAVGEYLTSKFDITFYCEERDNLVFRWEYSTSLFKDDTIRRFIQYFEKLMSEILENPRKKISDIEILPPGEKQKVLYTFNETDVPYPSEKTLYRLMEEQVERTPDKLAIMAKGRKLTYREMNRQTNRLARLLRERGLSTNITAGIMLDRSLEAVLSMLSIMKAGGTFLPVDPKLPENRITAMLEKAGARMLLTNSKISLERDLPRLVGNRELLHLDELEEQLNTYPVENLPHISGPDDIIYIIFTSGSTGNPKGAGVYYRGYTNLMHWYVNAYGLDERDRNLVVSSLSFDLTQKNIWTSLISGGTLCIPAVTFFEPRALLNDIHQYRVTWINCTPSMVYQLIEYEMASREKKLTSMRYFFPGGEPLVMTSMIDWLESDSCNAQIVNTYGPTECTDICSTYRITEPRRFMEEVIPIGKPGYNYKLYVLDRRMKPLPIGVAGELWIGGVGVGSGYVNDEELTAQKFVMHSLEPGKPPEMIYSSGDLVKWLPDGCIEFLGRIDHQVKIRGFRIELGEIESRLLSHPNIKEALVMARKDSGTEQYLCAYIVPHDAASLRLPDIKEHLADELPDYMVPPYFVVLEQMPLNNNGKVDRKALPEPDVDSGSNYVAPRNERESQLAEIWSEVLGIDKQRIGIHDNFFQLGGHSLRAAALVAKIHKTFSTEMPIEDLFKRPTISDIAQFITVGRENFYTPLQPVDEKEYYPLSSAQKRLYILDQMVPGTVTYNLPNILALEGVLDREKLEQSFTQLIHIHESLRTSFHTLDKEPIQRIHSSADFNVQYVDRTGVAVETALRELTQQHILPFDLSRAPLLRVVLVKLEDRKHLLLSDLHHIISDGISMGLFVNHLTALYNGQTIPQNTYRYIDFVQWQQDLKASPLIREQEDFWKKSFADEIPLLNPGLDYPRPPVQQFDGHRIDFKPEPQLAEKINNLANQTGSTPFTLLLALFVLLLYRLTGQEDIVVGTPTTGRRRPEFENIMGMFVNTLPLRFRFSGGSRFAHLLSIVKDTFLAAYDNQDYQYEELVEILDTRRDMSRNPLFDVVFTLQEEEEQGLETLSQLQFLPYDHDTRTAKFDLTWQCLKRGDQLDFSVQYSTRLFREETIRAYINYFQKLLAGITAGQDPLLDEIDILSDAEKQSLLNRYNNTVREYPSSRFIHRLFEEQVERTPHSIAAAVEGSPVTYLELNRNANRLARALMQNNLRPGDITAVLLEPGPDFLALVLAVLKTGGAFLPLSTDYPSQRIKYIAADSGARLIVTHDARRLSIEDLPTSCSVVSLEQLQSSNRDAVENIDTVEEDARRLAYIIYTSGSTGRPKGVAVEHRSLVNLCYWHNETFAVTPGDRVTQYASLGFDASVWEIFPYLIAGSSVHFINPQIKLDVEAINRYFHAHQISISFLPTQVCEQFIELENHSLRVLLTGGDKLNRYGETPYRFVNNYGPTENTVVTTSLTLENSYPDIPIGAPISNTRVYILGPGSGLQPVGVAGELCIAGDSLARGYLNRPTLTDETFVHLSLPGSQDKPVRVYRTGDLAHWTRDGNIQFLGRIDQQVKIRGYRIELGEILHRVSEHSNVKEAEVLVRRNPGGDKYLCAYIVPHGEFQSLELKNHLAGQLPSYMIPSRFITLEEMPLTPNGKIDRNALPLPDSTDDQEFTAPQNPIQEKLVRIWEDELGVSPIGIHDSFFEKGGHSLKAVSVINRVSREFGVSLPVQQLFRFPTPAQLAPVIRDSEVTGFHSIPKLPEQPHYPLSYTQRRLWHLYKQHPGDSSFNIPVRMTLYETVDESAVRKTLQHLAQRHESLRTHFKEIHKEPAVIINPAEDFIPPLEIIDWSSLTDQQLEEKRSRLLAEESVYIFDLLRSPLYRVKLIKCRPLEYDILFNIHHIVSDGWSMEILKREFITIYNAYKEKQPIELTPLELQYKDFAHWQSQLLSDNHKIAGAVEFWKEYLSGDLPVLNLPYDFTTPSNDDRRSAGYRFIIPGHILEQLRKLAGENQSSLFLILLGGFNILLSRVTGQKDILMAAPAAARQHHQLKNIIGMFVNTLVLRSHVPGDNTFREFFQQFRDHTFNALQYQDFPLELIFGRLKIKYPEISVFFNMINTGNTPEQDVPHPANIHTDPVQDAKFHLVCYLLEHKNGIEINCHYHKNRFKSGTIEKIMQLYLKTLENIAADPLKLISQYSASGKKRKLRRN